MCATVCPSQALAFVTPEEIERRREKPLNRFRFGAEEVTTKVFMMVPEGTAEIAVDVTDYMWEARP